MKKKKVRNVLDDTIKAMSKMRREKEIEEHGKPIHRPMIERSKKEYSRKKKHKNKE